MTTEIVVESGDRFAKRPEDARSDSGKGFRLLALAGAGAAAVALGAWLNLWYLPFVAGFAAGIFGAWRRQGFLRAAALLILSGPAPWAAVLAVRVLAGDEVGGTARTAAALAGLPAVAAVTVMLSLLVSLLLAGLGSWLGRAAFRALLPGRGSTTAGAEPTTDS
ncbi:hypothetical protein [Streptomyces sp. NPDC016172]|uniref:hypothetical protein n=1 Tax=Streptomyces sp. NPDC016172 TaxID=3364964 RepID=UPI0036FF3917